MNIGIKKPIIGGVLFILLIGEWGCAHQAIPPSPLPSSLQQQLGRIGVIARPTDESKALESPGTGRLSNIARGAGLGSVMGAGVGAQGGIAAVVMIPAGLALGFVGGAFYGAVASESWQDPMGTFQTIVAALDLNRVLPMHLAAFAQAHHYDITPLSTLSAESFKQESRYAEARREGFSTVLEIKDLMVQLVPAESLVNPSRRLLLSARVQLFRTLDGALLDDRVMTDELGPALSLDTWMPNQAERFRQEVQQASERLAEYIVTDYFMVYPFSERVTSSLMMAVHLKGLRPVYPPEEPGLPAGPGIHEEDIRAKYSRGEISDSFSAAIPNEFRVMAQRIDSLKPTLSWESFSSANVMYELRIWQAGRLGPEALVYSRTNLKEAEHTLETALEPSSLYYWSVRAHFSQDGKDRITEWSRRSVKHSVTSMILSWGIVALFPDPVQEGFYTFMTPPAAGLAPTPSASPSQNEVWCPWLHPEDHRWYSVVEIQSLKPTLRWDIFSGPGEDVTYDLAVWPGETGLREVPLGPIAYERRGLTEPFHRMEVPLDGGTYYVWALRARYRLNDQIEETKWSYDGDGRTSPSPRYCYFWTSSSLSSGNTQNLQTRPSQWFPWGNWPLSPP